MASLTCPAAGSIATRSSGAAPLFVFFDASGNNGTTDVESWNQDSTLTATANQSFRDLHFKWNFNDSGAGTWVTDGSSRNTADGPLAAHVFESSGTYSPTLTITNSSGATCSVTLSTITVTAASTTWASTTACITSGSTLPAAGVGNCPSNATLFYNNVSNWHTGLSTAIAAGARQILFHGGDSFVGTNTGYKIVATGPGRVSTYGAGNVTVTIPNGGTSGFPACLAMGASDWRLENTNFGGPTTATGGVPCLSTGSFFSPAAELLFLRNNLSGDFSAYFGFDPSTILAPGQYDQFAEIENTSTNYNDAASGYTTYNAVHHSALMGNTFDGSAEPMASASGAIRIGCFISSVFAHNVVKGSQAGRQTFKMHAESDSGANDRCQNGNQSPTTLPVNQFWEVSDNRFISINTSGDGNGAAAWNVAIDPQNTVQNEYSQDGIIERNYFDSTDASATGNARSQIELDAERVVIRNNIFHLVTTAGSTDIHIFRRNSAVPADNIEVYENTFYQSGNTAGNTWVQSDTQLHFNGGGAIDKVTVRNNLAYNPAVSVTMFDPQGTTNATADHNLTASSSPFSGTPAATIASYAISNGSLAQGGGAPLGQPPNVPVPTDISLAVRPSPPSYGAWDIVSTVSGTCTPTTATAGVTSVTCSETDGGTLTSWNFGDGSALCTTAPCSHVYVSTGPFSPTLVDSLGSHQFLNLITVNPAFGTLSLNPASSSVPVTAGGTPAAQSTSVSLSVPGTWSAGVPVCPTGLGATITVSPTSGTGQPANSVSITAGAVPAATTAGTYTCTVAFTSNQASPSTVTYTEKIVVSAAAATLVVNPTTINISTTSGTDATNATAVVQLTGGTGTWSSGSLDQTWCQIASVVPGHTGAGSGDTITFSFTGSGAASNSTCHVTITGSGGVLSSPQTIAINLTVTPVVLAAANPAGTQSWTLTTISGTAAAFGVGGAPAGTFVVTRTPSGTWTSAVTCQAPTSGTTGVWISLSTTTGTGGETVTISTTGGAVNSASLAANAGAYSCSIVISSTGATPSTVTLSVALFVSTAATPTMTLTKTSFIAITPQGQNPPDDQTSLSNTGSAQLSTAGVFPVNLGCNAPGHRYALPIPNFGLTYTAGQATSIAMIYNGAEIGVPSMGSQYCQVGVYNSSFTIVDTTIPQSIVVPSMLVVQIPASGAN